ncbi:MAG: hypothetical protein Q7R87_01550 [Nanoarchaeota archaeon]|nr:hypothetical protein [Nanoarchaeota archaeon]
MEPIFTLPYPEYAIAEYLSKQFKQKDGYSILIPTSRQQKGFDLVILNLKSGKSIKIQVKASRTWTGEFSKRKSKYRNFNHYTRFKVFDIDEGMSDYYLLHGLYPIISSEGVAKNSYSEIILALDESEMIKFLSDIKQKSGKSDSYFGFGFDNDQEVYLTRGFIGETPPPLSQHLLKNKMGEMKDKLSR